MSSDVAATYLSLKNRTSCCNSVTASKDKSGSHLPGVLGGGFFDNIEGKFGLTPADNKSVHQLAKYCKIKIFEIWAQVKVLGSSYQVKWKLLLKERIQRLTRTWCLLQVANQPTTDCPLHFNPSHHQIPFSLLASFCQPQPFWPAGLDSSSHICHGPEVVRGGCKAGTDPRPGGWATWSISESGFLMVLWFYGLVS